MQHKAIMAIQQLIAPQRALQSCAPQSRATLSMVYRIFLAREVCIVYKPRCVHVFAAACLSHISAVLLPWQLALVPFETFDRGTACFFVTSLMLMSATITTAKYDWPSQSLYVVCQQDDAWPSIASYIECMVKCIYSEQACTCINACFALSCKQEWSKKSWRMLR